MLAWIVSLVASVFNFIPATIWVIVLVVGTILFRIGGEGWFGFLKIVLALFAFYGFLWVLAYFLPTWLENVAVLAVVGLFWWLWRN